MNYWNTDADTIKLDSNWKKIPFILNKQIQDFVDNKDLFFVVAAKGFGKTLALKSKSKKFRENNITSKFYPKTELCEKIGKSDYDVSFSSEDLLQYKERKHWATLWKLCILSVILIENDIELPDEIKILLGDANTITDILNILLNQRKEFHKISTVISKKLNPIATKLEASMSVFIDNVDEAFEDHVGFTLKEKKYSGNLSETVWINSQLGLIDAAKSIHFSNSHLKIYATIRKEAFGKSHKSTDLQIETAYCSNLSYSEDELRQIFYKNIELTPTSQLANPQSSEPLVKFLGFSQYEHEFVKSDGKKFKEDPFKYILRHTFGRPREIVLMGQKINQEISPESRNSKKFKIVVNNVSSKLLKQYKEEVIPFFRNDEYEALCKEVNSNVLQLDEVEKISSIISEKYKFDHVFCTFYNLGLVGYVLKKHDHSFIQLFQPVGENLFAGSGSLPKSEFYLLHPSMEANLKGKNYSFEHNKFNVIGNGYTFSPPEIIKWTNYHVHFGAGRLGLGLVVPFFNKLSRLAVIQRPSIKWKNLEFSELILYINEQENLTLQYICDKTPLSKVEEAISKGENIFCCSDDLSLIKTILDRSTSISTSLGDGICSIINKINQGSYPVNVNLYPFENDQELVEGFSKNLSMKNNKFQIVPVVVDKICDNVSRKRNKIYVTTESYSSIIIYPKNKQTYELFSGSPDYLHLCGTHKEWDFYYKRKFWLVNGIHMLYAIFAYSELVDAGIERKKWKHYCLSLFRKFPDISYHLDIFRKFQICRLIITTDNAVLRKVFNTDSYDFIFNNMLEYSDDVMTRINSHVDYLTRILNINNFDSFRKKYQQRIKETIDFILNNNNDVVELLKFNNPDINDNNIHAVTNTLNQKLIQILLAK